jgi:hypothetical protein
MGQLVIETTENINRIFHINDNQYVRGLLKDLEKIENETSSLTPMEKLLKSNANIIPPRRNNLKEDGDAVLGIWADRDEDAMEIARKIRDKNNGKI